MTAMIRHLRSLAHVQLHEVRNFIMYKLCIVYNNVPEVRLQLIETLELYDGKLSRTVLRGESSRKARDLPGAG